METQQVKLRIEIPNIPDNGQIEPIPEPPMAPRPKKKLSMETKPGGALQKKKRLTAQQIDSIVDKVVKQYQDGINVTNLMEVLITIMTTVKDFAQLGGSEKKELVIEILCHVVDETDSGDLEVLDPVIKTIIPHAIDLFVETEKGRLKFTNKKIKKFCPCLK